MLVIPWRQFSANTLKGTSEFAPTCAHGLSEKALDLTEAAGTAYARERDFGLQRRDIRGPLAGNFKKPPWSHR